MDSLGSEVASLKSRGLEPVSPYLLVFEADEMDRIMALIARFKLPAAVFPLVRDYVTLRIAGGAAVDQVIRDLERILTVKGQDHEDRLFVEDSL